MKRFTGKFGLAASLALVFSGPDAKVLAYLANYGPFQPEHEPAAVRLQSCELVREAKPSADDIVGGIRES